MPFQANYYALDSAVPEKVTLDFSQTGVAASRPGQEQFLLLPFGELSMRLGGHDGKRVIISINNNEHSMVLEHSDFLDGLEKAPGAEGLASAIAELRKQRQGELSTNRNHWLIFFACIVLAGLSTFLAIDRFVALAAQHIPPSIEQMIGDMVLSSYQKKHELSEDSEQAKRVQRILDRLVKHVKSCPYKFKAYVETTPDVNAFALPGGNVVVLSGLLDQASNDSEVAGIVGHEIGHVLCRHSLKQALHQVGVIGCITIICGGLSPEQASWLSQGMNLEALQFGRTQEDEADSKGVDLSYKADYDPHGLITFFERMQKTQSLGGVDKALEILSTHPCNADRIKHVKAEIARLQKAGKPK